MVMRISCANCEYYFVTHDPARPWGCKRFGFKSQVLPNYAVKNTTGIECAYHTVKKVRKIKQENLRNGNTRS